MQFIKFRAFSEAIAEKKHNLGSDQLKIALSNSDPLSSTSAVLADITQISYTNLSSRNITTTSSVQTGGLYKLKCSDLTLLASGAVATFRYIILYNDTATNDDLIGYYDYGLSVTLANGQSFKISFDQTNGVLTIE